MTLAGIVSLRKKLLDTYLALGHTLLGEVGDAEATVAQSANNTIASTL
jgi:hypothetical protein